jgi:plasmid stabilization system protein ParE
MKIFFSKFAKKELDDAFAYYETEQLGLGFLFKNEIKSSLKRITEHPDAWSIEINEVRKALLHRFPYKILYSIEKDCILILAIAHQHRKPDYWIR